MSFISARKIRALTAGVAVSTTATLAAVATAGADTGPGGAEMIEPRVDYRAPVAEVPVAQVKGDGTNTGAAESYEDLEGFAVYDTDGSVAGEVVDVGRGPDGLPDALVVDLGTRVGRDHWPVVIDYEAVRVTRPEAGAELTISLRVPLHELGSHPLFEAARRDVTMQGSW